MAPIITALLFLACLATSAPSAAAWPNSPPPPSSPPPAPPRPPPPSPVALAAANTVSLTLTLGGSYAYITSSNYAFNTFKNAFISNVADEADVDTSAVTINSVTSGSIVVSATVTLGSSSAANAFLSLATTSPSSLFSNSFRFNYGSVTAITGTASGSGASSSPTGSPTSVASSSTTTSSSGGLSIGVIAGGAGGGGAALAVAAALFATYRRRRAARMAQERAVGRIGVEFLPLPPPSSASGASSARSAGDQAAEGGADGAGPSTSAAHVALDMTGQPTYVREANEVVAWTAIRHIINDRNIIGKGAFGTVYRGTLAGGRRIAIKRVPLDSDGHSAAAAELAILQRLHHPNLLRMRGFCIYSGAVYILTDLAAASLQQRLLGTAANAAPMGQGQRLEVLRGSVKAVAYLHGLKPAVLHRDLKPDNILLDGAGRPLVADFGIARTSPELKVHTHIASRNLGTLGYVAPESQRLGQYSAKSDVYALGVVMLQMITKKEAIVLPSDAGSSGRGDGVAEELREWLARCLAAAASPSAADNLQLFDSNVQWDAEVLQGVLDLGMRCTAAEPGQRPALEEVETALAGLSERCSATGEAHSEAHLCQICLDAPRSTVCLPCQHAWACRACAERTLRTRPVCVICRARVERVQQVQGPVLETYVAPSPRHQAEGDA